MYYARALWKGREARDKARTIVKHQTTTCVGEQQDASLSEELAFSRVHINTSLIPQHPGLQDLSTSELGLLRKVRDLLPPQWQL
jgi:hypothetical protein